jgi:hypothetical protein
MCFWDINVPTEFHPLSRGREGVSGGCDELEGLGPLGGSARRGEVSVRQYLEVQRNLKHQAWDG